MRTPEQEIRTVVALFGLILACVGAGLLGGLGAIFLVGGALLYRGTK